MGIHHYLTDLIAFSTEIIKHTIVMLTYL